MVHDELAEQLSRLNLEASAAADPVPGLDQPLQELRELIGWPLLYAKEAQALGVEWPRGVLLHGPSGCGKNLLVDAVASEFHATVYTVTASTVFGAFVGESEERLRSMFEEAYEQAKRGQPAILFLDELDVLCPRRDAQRGHESRVVAQLLTLMDGVGVCQPGNAALGAGRVAVIGATSRPNWLDPALRRPGRLDREVGVNMPDSRQRAAILRWHCRRMPLSADVDLQALAAGCHGYSGADLAALAREAATSALQAAALNLQQNRQGDHVPPVCSADFKAALRRVGPSIVRGAAAEFAPVRWEDVGGLAGVKASLSRAVEWPLRHADAFERLGISAPRGVLLYGPPGCSKTTLARAAATASGAALLSLGCAQLFSMYVGEGEATLRDAFRRARLAAPAIVFLDELDAVAVRREEGDGSGKGGGADAGTRVLTTLLTEMDGLEQATGVLVLAATNRPSALDSALLRPGRFDCVLLVPPPDAEGREEVLRVHCRGMPLAPDVDLAEVAADTNRFTGAELSALCREAAMAALREDLSGAAEVAARHFATARAAMWPALTPQDLDQYLDWAKARHRVR